MPELCAIQHSVPDITNRPLGDIEQRYNYIPAQPVLSCRSVNIDLSGTRTYRPKSSDDILSEQQKLIRRIYGKIIRPTTSVARPNTRLGRSTSARPQSESSSRYLVEVRGRPLTSLSSACSPRESKASLTLPARPKTKGRYRNIQPATESYLELHFGDELRAKNQHLREINQKINSYWESGQSHLAQGIFMRGRPGSEDVPPKLDAWLTFGGAAGGGGDGVIDAFASFKNSEEYYNIEGSIRKKLDSNEQKLKNYSAKKDNSLGESFRGAIDSDAWVELKNTFDEEADEDWQELVKDKLTESMDTDRNAVSLSSSKSVSVMNSGLRNKSASKPSTVPLSWVDQCSQSDVKIIQSKIVKQDTSKRVASETMPVKFEKLSSQSERLPVSQTSGFKFKQRSPTSSTSNVSSKLKVVYIDSLSPAEEEKVKGMSVDEIVNFKLENLNRESTAVSIHRSLTESSKNNTKIQDNNNITTQSLSQNGSTLKGENKISRPSSLSSQSSVERGHSPSPKLKTVPVHPSANQPSGELTISTKNVSQSESTKIGKVPGKLSPGKPLYRSGAAQGNSIKPGLQQGDAEYILITSQLKVTPVQTAGPSVPQTSAPVTPYVFSPGSNTPRDRSPSPHHDIHMNAPVLTTYKTEISVQGNSISLDTISNDKLPEQETVAVTLQADRKEENISMTLQERQTDSDSKSNTISKEALGSGAATLAINIPTAEDLLDRESPAPSPSHLERPRTAQL
ncbi:hypothetical protein Btru_014234 [Bulinus truncatus]|nr:hypothetical protein Btru_014234 [Bulinus truncatus]